MTDRQLLGSGRQRPRKRLCPKQDEVGKAVTATECICFYANRLGRKAAMRGQQQGKEVAPNSRLHAIQEQRTRGDSNMGVFGEGRSSTQLRANGFEQ